MRDINLNPSYDELHEHCKHLALQVKYSNFVPDYIVGVTRGGLPIATIISHQLDNIPIIPINYSSTKGKGDNVNHPNALPQIERWPGEYVQNKGIVLPNLLIVDDICDSGYTLFEICAHYMQAGHDLRALAIFYKIHDNPPIKPDYYSVQLPEDSGWVIFPWENIS